MPSVQHRAHDALASSALATLQRQLLGRQRPAEAAALGRWRVPSDVPQDPLDSWSPAPLLPGSRSSSIVHSFRFRTNESNEGLCTFGRVQLKVISLINFLGFKSALVLICFNLKVRVNSISKSQIVFPREPKIAQMPIFDRSLGWVAGG